MAATWALLACATVPAAADPAAVGADVPPVPVIPAPPGAAPAGNVVTGAAPAAAAVAQSDGAVIVSAPPATSVTPDGWALTVGARNEVLRNVNPLTTALSSRDYDVSGVFHGVLRGPPGAGPPRGVLEVGYQIGCAIDMSTSQGVTSVANAGLTPSVGLGGVDTTSPLPEALNPILLAPASGGIAVGLKPGIVNIVPVAKKDFKGTDPWVSVSGFHVKIDGCVGESFIRSYAVLTHSTDQSDAIQGYYGTARNV
jgi:hypothetical protein